MAERSAIYLWTAGQYTDTHGLREVYPYRSDHRVPNAQFADIYYNHDAWICADTSGYTVYPVDKNIEPFYVESDYPGGYDSRDRAKIMQSEREILGKENLTLIGS